MCEIYFESATMFNLFKKRPTSEETLKGWLDSIKEQDEAKFLLFCQKTWKRKAKDIQGYTRIGVKDYRVMSCEQISRVMHKFKVSIRRNNGVSLIQLTVIKERKAYRASRLFGRWGVNPSSWRLLS